MDGNWAPAPRRHLRHQGQRQVQALRELRPLLRQDPERPGRPRPVGRRRRDPRRLLRRRPDPPDSRTASLAGGATQPLRAGRRGRRRRSTPDAKSTYQRRVPGRRRVRGGAATSTSACATSTATSRASSRTTSRLPLAAFDLGCPGAGERRVLHRQHQPGLPHFNCDPGRRPDRLAGGFEDPVHKYDAVEVTANKSFSDNWSLMASYRWSKLKGNFEGFFRNDNGQSDPSITSLFDFPTNDPSYTAVGAPQFGYRGDIRFQGCTLGCGVLPNDRTAPVQGLRRRYAFAQPQRRAWASTPAPGISLTALAANPNYQQLRRDPGDACAAAASTPSSDGQHRSGLPMRLQRRPARRLHDQVRASAADDPGGGRVQPVQPPDADLVRLRQRPGLRLDEPELRLLPSTAASASRRRIRRRRHSVWARASSGSEPDPLVGFLGAGAIPPPFSLSSSEEASTECGRRS